MLVAIFGCWWRKKHFGDIFEMLVTIKSVTNITRHKNTMSECWLDIKPILLTFFRMLVPIKFECVGVCVGCFFGENGIKLWERYRENSIFRTSPFLATAIDKISIYAYISQWNFISYSDHSKFLTKIWIQREISPSNEV